MITGTTFTAKFTLVLFSFDICFEVFSCFSTATGSFLKYNTLLFIFFTSRVLEDLLLPFYLFLLPVLITSFPGSFPVSVSSLHCKCSIHFHLDLTVTKLKITFFFFGWEDISLMVALIFSLPSSQGDKWKLLCLLILHHTKYYNYLSKLSRWWFRWKFSDLRIAMHILNKHFLSCWKVDISLIFIVSLKFKTWLLKYITHCSLSLNQFSLQ